jgi:hypothetical protein
MLWGAAILLIGAWDGLQIGHHSCKVGWLADRASFVHVEKVPLPSNP